MDKHYKKLMEREKTTLAGFIDCLFILFLATLMSMGYFLIKSRNMLASIIITTNIDIIIILLMSKMQNIKLNRFKTTLNNKIRNKLILERLVFLKDEEIRIKGFERIGESIYKDSQNKRYVLLSIYPQSVLCPKDITDYMNFDGIIASCSFDDDCKLLASRMNRVLYDKEFLLGHIIMDIDEAEIEKEIKAEVQKISEIKNKRKSTSFARERWSRYLMSSLLLLLLSGFMGRYRIIYIAFGGMCMSFCFISALLSKSQ